MKLLHAKYSTAGLGAGLIAGMALMFACAGAGCAAGAKRSPEGLRDAYAAALRADDPDAAYALLAPEVQARTDIEHFRTRWANNQKQHESALKAITDIDEDRRAPILTGTTTHEGGVVIHWAHTSAGFMIIDGLPGIPDTSTPAATARALISVLRGIARPQLERVLTTEVLQSFGEDWSARADAIEAALEQPGSLSYSADTSRAVLRYAGGRSITFEQTNEGWRIAEIR